MKVVYKPEGVKEEKWKRWDFDPNRLLSPEAEAIERYTGMDFSEWADRFPRSARAVHGFLFVMLKRDNPTLKWDEVKFVYADLDFELDDEEQAAQIAALESKAAESGLTDAEADLLAELRAQAPEVDDVSGGDVEDEAPKADDA